MTCTSQKVIAALYGKIYQLKWEYLTSHRFASLFLLTIQSRKTNEQIRASKDCCGPNSRPRPVIAETGVEHESRNRTEKLVAQYSDRVAAGAGDLHRARFRPGPAGRLHHTRQCVQGAKPRLSLTVPARAAWDDHQGAPDRPHRRPAAVQGCDRKVLEPGPADARPSQPDRLRCR